jgi:hypothetical protein
VTSCQWTIFPICDLIPVNEISNVKFYVAGNKYSQFLTPNFPSDYILYRSRTNSSTFQPPWLPELVGRSRNVSYDLMEMAWGSLPVVSFTTTYNFYRGDPVGTIRIPFQGLYQAREFYQPKPEIITSSKPDNRTTIYWNPEVKTDTTGKAHISFYNSDLKGKAMIRISGVSYQLRDAGSAVSDYVSR